MMQVLTLLGFLTFALAVLCAFLIVKLPSKASLKFVLIPIALLIGMLVFENVEKVQGYPYAAYPAESFVLYDYRVVGSSSDKATIEIWAIQHGHTRIYVVPFDPQIEQQLRQAMLMLTQGNGRMTLNFAKKGRSQGDESMGLYQTYVPLQGIIPKKQEAPPVEQEAPPPAQ